MARWATARVSRFLGIDLAWGLGGPHPLTGRARRPNETGLCLLDDRGVILEAGWVRGVEAVAEWVAEHERPGDVIAIDAPLIVVNETGMRQAERAVGRGYGRWKVAANASSRTLAARAGEVLLARLGERDIRYTDGTSPPPHGTTVAFECYPYTTLVGAPELGYEVERPRYKRLIPTIPRDEARARRAVAADDLLQRMARMADARPPLRMDSHPETARLLDEESPLRDAAYKHREDLLDAVLCAWTAALWLDDAIGRRGAPGEHVQILGAAGSATPGEVDAQGRRATIVAPARPEQRR